MTIAIISHPDCLLHEMGEYHPECPQRLLVIEQALKDCDFADQLRHYEAPLVSREALLPVHDAAYVESIFKASPRVGYTYLDPDVLMNPHSLTAALRAAGAGVYAVDLLMSHEVSAAFCNVRPPGHHACRDRAMGFCIFNNVAVAVAYALSAYSLKRAAIIDFDVHHGNGTEDIFMADERVLYCSTFEHPFYPFSGADTHSDHIINIPLAAGTTGEVFRQKVEASWFEQVKAFKPDILFFSAGFDAYVADQMADIRLEPDDYFWITRKIKAIAEECCQGRMVSFLEGGYDLNGLGGCAVAHLRGFL